MKVRRFYSPTVLLATAILTLASFGSGCKVHGGVGILGSKHDLSAVGPGPIKAATETEVCLFCHTPHRALDIVPLWNHEMSQATYTPYTSSTKKAAVGQPSGASKLCLSCHDGTVALGAVHSGGPITMLNNLTFMPAGSSRIGTDLSDDHPVSMKYDAALVAANGQLKDPSTLNQKVRLDHDGLMQCTSCHEPHDNRFPNFLVMDDRGGELCISCHDLKSWNSTVHKTSTRTWSGVGLDPWPHTTYTTVADNACQNCHAPHAAGTGPRLLTQVIEEQNCNSCHGGTVATKNIAAEFNKSSIHPVSSTSGIHDPMEDTVNPVRHVECVDCHNPHAANATTAVAPNASGALAGVKGVMVGGGVIDPLTKDYELCFRCHADSVAGGQALVNRQFVETNTRREFSSTSASYHPITAVGKNNNVPSLIAPWTTTRLMYCGDCHNNNQGPGANGTGPNGPHGSIYAPILERHLLLTDHTPESSQSYALCYKCHSRTVVTSEQITSWRYHKLHVVDKETACTTCHDPHGVQSKTHLINFNRNYVTPSSNGRLEFVDQGLNRGNCSLTCHGKDHQALSY